MKMLVFAGSYDEHRHFKMDHGIPHLHSEWSYVEHVGRVMGCIRGTPYVLYGTWYEREDIEQFLRLAKGKGFIRVEPVEESR